jgi:hypothetical protein
MQSLLVAVISNPLDSYPTASKLSYLRKYTFLASTTVVSLIENEVPSQTYFQFAES